MLDLNIIEIGQSDYASPMILVEDPGQDPRPYIDYRLLNANVRTQFFPMPNIEERVERVAVAKYIAVIDLSKRVLADSSERACTTLLSLCHQFWDIYSFKNAFRAPKSALLL
ncbi:hypothetical protein AVEN_217155-1 [Araneus ventricosus]|uniref:Uncharacterized protein n=1 Tax=Araneus ventricosus TaxID=182803 RepID=A0A4Y2GPL0_ARAVE|nr:hypothetical protein AVEN_217155-1 [Araneus ventricosus]